MGHIINLGIILMKTNKIELIYSDYHNFLAKKRLLKETRRKFSVSIKNFATEDVQKVIDCNQEGFSIGRIKKNKINLYNKLYYIRYEGIRILPHDTNK